MPATQQADEGDTACRATQRAAGCTVQDHAQSACLGGCAPLSPLATTWANQLFSKEITILGYIAGARWSHLDVKLATFSFCYVPLGAPCERSGPPLPPTPHAPSTPHLHS